MVGLAKVAFKFCIRWRSGRGDARWWSWLGLVVALALLPVAGLCKETGFTMYGLFVVLEVHH